MSSFDITISIAISIAIITYQLTDLRNDVAIAQDDRLELFLLTLFIRLLALR